MGYFVKGKEIAKISPKARAVSLSASPNYVQFESKEVICKPDSDITILQRPAGDYVRSSLSIDIDIIRDHMSSIYRGEETNATIGIASIDFRERSSGEEFKFLIRFEGHEPNTGITINQELFPNDIILSRNEPESSLKSFASVVALHSIIRDKYEIEASGGKVTLLAKNTGDIYGIEAIEIHTLYRGTDWYTDPLTGAMYPQSNVSKYAIELLDVENETVRFEESLSCQPTKTSITIGEFIGYQFENNIVLPAGVEAVDLNKGLGFKNLEDYITQNKKRINPYNTYFKEKSGNIYRFVNYTRFAIKDKVKGIERWFQGIDPIMKLSGAYETSDYAYDLADNPIQTAQNLKEALLRCPYIRDNFKVSSPIDLDENTGFIEQSSIVNLESLYAGKRFNFEIILDKENKGENDNEYAEYKKRFDSFAQIKLPDYDSVNTDTINEGAESCEIQIDMYADTGLFLGQDDRPDIDDLGSYVTTLSKTYFNQPVWFDLNSIQTKKYKPPFGAIDSESELQKSDAGVWFDAATYSDRRFVAKRVTSTMSESFYYSPVLYTLTGYERSLDQNDIEKYVYDISVTSTPDKLVRPLTLQPDLLHVRGQIQYFNFVMKDRDHDHNQSIVGLEYELLTQSGVLLDTIIDHQQAASQFKVVNTIALDIDRFADQYSNLGIVRIRLCHDGQRVSQPLILNIQPSYLHRVHDFIFLNSLGGWSSFNFGDQDQLDFKTTPTTFFRNQTPSSTLSSSIETVYSKAVEERFVVRTQPITLATADWLKEISTSIAVFECKSKRYIVVDEMNVKYTTQDNFVRVEMKYHYSDSFNAQY